MSFDFCGFQSLKSEDPQMTLHIILPGRDNTLVWIADQKAVLSSNTVAYVEKVLYLSKQRVALSTWGEKALLIRDDFAKLVVEGKVDLSDPERASDELRSYATRLFGPPADVEPQPFQLIKPVAPMPLGAWFWLWCRLRFPDLI